MVTRGRATGTESTECVWLNAIHQQQSHTRSASTFIDMHPPGWGDGRACRVTHSHPPHELCFMPPPGVSLPLSSCWVLIGPAGTFQRFGPDSGIWCRKIKTAPEKRVIDLWRCDWLSVPAALGTLDEVQKLQMCQNVSVVSKLSLHYCAVPLISWCFPDGAVVW